MKNLSDIEDLIGSRIEKGTQQGPGTNKSKTL
jgi:hypothetical protein